MRSNQVAGPASFHPLGTCTIFRLVRHVLLALQLTVVFASFARAQAPSVNSSTFTPPPGVGHDYIGLLSETVNPATGAVSVRINLPSPTPARGPAVPLGFGYDSNFNFVVPGVPGQASWATIGTPWAIGGWSLLVPTLSEIQGQESFAGTPPQTCGWWGDFLFTSPNGAKAGLGLSLAQQNTGNDESCGLRTVLSNGGDFFQAFIPSTVIYNYGSQTGQFPPPVTIAGSNGTVYYYSNLNTVFSGIPGGEISLPTFIEDRNGNKATFNVTPSSPGVFSITDPAGRTVVSSNGFGKTGDAVAISGISKAVTTNWETGPSPSWNLGQVNLNPSDASNCKYGFPTPPTGGAVIQSIVLPNGESYQFLYDSTYGLLKQIVYPSGGTVTYTWEVNPQSQTAAWPDSGAVQNKIGCMWRYGTPAVATRVVSYDGKTNALQQSFSYSQVGWSSTDALEWTTMSTTVTTSDLVTGQSFATVYDYEPVYGTLQPLDAYTLTPGGVPAETTIQYYGSTNTSIPPLRTVTKQWAGLQGDLLACQLTTLDNGLVSGAFYKYSGDVVTDKKEYDFGQLTTTSGCLNTGVAPSSPTPTRETVATPHSFAVSPIYSVNPSVLDLPSSVIIYGNGSRIAETDYSYDQFSITSASSTQHDETNYPASLMSPRGNATTVVQQCIQAAPACSSGNPTTIYTYDETGQVLSMKDPNGNTTKYSYSDSYVSGDTLTSGAPLSNTNAYLTQITYPSTNGIAHVESFSYDYPSGQLTVSRDQNGQSTKYHYNDSFARPTETDYADTGQNLLVYNDAPPAPTVTAEDLITSGNYLKSVTTMNGMGMATEAQITSDQQGTDTTAITYTGTGRIYTVTNPYRSGDTIYKTTYSYDALGRVTKATNQDSTAIQTTYTGRATEVTDEGNGTKVVQRISQTDALGRLNSICEVSNTTLSFGTSAVPGACGQDIAGTGFLTSYSDDALGNVLSVSQGSLNPRTYAYDSLSRLTSSNNPESGTITYNYDANSNLTSTVSPKPNQTNPSVTLTTTSQYDALNRLTQKSYSDGTTPTANFVYDVTLGWTSAETNLVGRMSYADTPGTTSIFGYDPVGRVVVNSQCTPMTCGKSGYTVTYAYDLLGDMTSSTNGQGVTLTYGYDLAARLTSLTSSLSDANHPSSLLSGVQYNAPGSLTSASMGTVTSTSGISESRTYDSRLRVQGISTGVNTPSGSVGLESVTYGYAPNGDVTSLADGPTGNWAFKYDDFNRLVSTTITSFGSGPYAYAYDRYGNRWQQTANGSCTAGTASCISFDSNNHVTGGILTYDAAGNVTADNMHHYTYDAEDRLIQVDAGTTASYIYDAFSRRAGSTISGASYDYVVDLAGHTIAQINSSGLWQRGEVYLPSGRHLATYAQGLTYFSSVDGLDSERVRSTQTESSYESCASLPFGDGQSCFGPATGAVSPLHFTGNDRDSESGLDNFEVRMLGSGFGRFTSPDPAGIFAANPFDPQQFNLYSYVRNNPTSFIDPTGLGCFYLNDSGNVIRVLQDDCDSDDDDGIYVDASVDVNSWTQSQDKNWVIFAIKDPDTGLDEPTLGHACVGDCSAPAVSITVNGTSTMGPFPPVSPPIATTIGPDPDWFHSRRAGCIGTGGSRVVKDLIFYDELNAVSGALAQGSLKPLKDLFAAGSVAGGAQKIAEHVAENRAAQLTLKGAFKSAGMRETGAAIGRRAGTFGKVAGALGLAITGYNAYQAYTGCMAY